MNETAKEILRGALRAARQVDGTLPDAAEAIRRLDGERDTPKEEPIVMNQAGAARFLSTSRFFIYQLVRSKQLTPVQIRGLKRYRVVDLKRLAGLAE
jgi:hypothetical protein